jgi:hypothetical protein
LVINQTEFKDNLKEKCRQNYTKYELNALQGQIGHTNIFEEDKLFYVQNRLHLSAKLYNCIIKKEQNTEHWGRDKTINLINRNFSIPEINIQITDLTRECNTC